MGGAKCCVCVGGVGEGGESHGVDVLCKCVGVGWEGGGDIQESRCGNTHTSNHDQQAQDYTIIAYRWCRPLLILSTTGLS